VGNSVDGTSTTHESRFARDRVQELNHWLVFSSSPACRWT